MAGNVVYFGSHDAHLYAVDALSGKELGKIKLGGRIVSTLWPADGVVYVGCDDGSLYAVQCATMCYAGPTFVEWTIVQQVGIRRDSAARDSSPIRGASTACDLHPEPPL